MDPISQHSVSRLSSACAVCNPSLLKDPTKPGLGEATAIQVREMDEGCVIAQKDSPSPALLPRSLCLDFIMWLVPWDHRVYSYLFCFSRQGLLKVPLAPSRNFAYRIHCLSLCPLFLNASHRFTTADSVQTNHLLWWSCIFLMDRTSLLALLPRHHVLL